MKRLVNKNTYLDLFLHRHIDTETLLDRLSLHLFDSEHIIKLTILLRLGLSWLSLELTSLALSDRG